MSDPKPTDSTSKPKTRLPKPRAGVVRKSQAERDAHAKQEAEKAAIRAAAAVHAAGKPSQPARTAASKKKDNSRDNRDSSQSATGGVFGAGTGARQAWKRSAYDVGQSEMLEGQEGVKPSDGPSLQGQENFSTGERKQGAAGGASGSRSSRQTREGLAIESDDEPDESRRDIEKIWISSDEEEDDSTSMTRKGKAKTVRQGRNSRQGGGLRPVRAPRMSTEEQSSDDEKTEGDEMEVAGSDGLQAKQDIPSSPEISKRGKPGRRVGARAKDSKLATETVEEKAERKRLGRDVEKLRKEFALSPKLEQDEDDMAVDSGLTSDKKLFLFQFPPLIPLLVDQAQTADGQQPVHASDPTIKSDPDGSAPAPSTATEAKPASASSQLKPQIDGILTANDSLKLPAGRVGKLRVHKSGKVTLDWGGTNMEVRYGTEVNFLQDAVLVETPSQSGEGEDNSLTTPSGTTYALGQVQKKMIVIPDWQKLYN